MNAMHGMRFLFKSVNVPGALEIGAPAFLAFMALAVK
jgi:hypothetical protein